MLIMRASICASSEVEMHCGARDDFICTEIHPTIAVPFTDINCNC